MKIFILHLSDIHIRSEKDVILSRKTKLFDTFKNRLDEVELIFFVLSGDIVYSGKQEEYLIALELISSLKSMTETKLDKDVKIIVVPGNHDCDFDLGNASVRELVIHKIISGGIKNIDPNFIESCCEVQKPFQDFLQLIQDENNLKYSDELLWVYTYAIGDKKIQFNCYNTSWVSQIHEEQGKICFPINRYDTNLLNEEANLIISIFHHPYVWQQAVNAREVMDTLESNSSIIITGHDHINSEAIKHDLIGGVTEYIEGGVLQDKDNRYNSSFNVIIIDLDKFTQDILNYEYDASENFYKQNKSKILTYNEMLGIVFRSNELSPHIFKFIEDPGALYYHRHKTEITLNDIYIFPDLKVIKLSKMSKGVDEIVSARSLLDVNNKSIVLGQDKSGKTTLCKAFYSTLHQKGFIPILINGKDVSSHGLDDFIKVVAKSYVDQYLDVSAESYYQLNLNNVYLIIDDYDRCRLNTKYKALLITYICNKYINILITVSELFGYEEIAYDTCDADYRDSLSHYQIMPFGHILRAQLINKWNHIGRHYEIDEFELLKKNDEAKKIIDSVVGKNLVPAYPIFILIVLQSIESGKSHDLRSSSQGYYYNVLITMALNKLNLKPDEMNAYYNIIAELSYLLFVRNTKEITDEQFTEFYQHISCIYIVTEDKNVLKENLKAAKLLEERNGRIYFKYKYIYYYFVAKYLADNITSMEIKTVIEKICPRVFNEEFANILMFLTHHSKDPFILETILSSAKNLFSEFTPLKLDNDVTTINELIKEIPKIVLREKHFQEARKEKLEAKDKVEPMDVSLNDEEIEYDLDEKTDELDLLSRLIQAFKTIEIVGQIIRIHYGTIRKEQAIELSEQAYLIALRAQKCFFEFIETQGDGIVKYILVEAEKNGIEDKKGIENLAKELLFHLSAYCTYGMFKKVSSSIGSEKLSEVYRTVYNKNEFISVDMINTAIKQETSWQFPLVDAKRIRDKNKKNNLVCNLLQKLAVDHLYMYPTNDREKQKICSALSIPIESQRFIDSSSKVKMIS
jgi:predicted MPP superfamily phosphohydrolase